MTSERLEVDAGGDGGNLRSPFTRRPERLSTMEGRAQGRRTVLMLVLGVMLIAPMLWVRWDSLHPGAVPVMAGGSGGSAAFENGERMLLGTGVPLLPEPLRPCKQGVFKQLPKLVYLQKWVSVKQRPRESITLLTQLSADRLVMLENQCRTWPDPIVAVVYVPLLRNPSGGLPSIPTYHNTTLEDVTRGISSFHAFMEATAQCALRVELVGQYLSRRSPRPYPINSLRNRALSAARTDLVLLLDVDFAASPMLGLPEPGYRDAAVYNQMVELTAKRRAIVLPAFEITNRKQDLTMAQNFARNMVMAGKEEVRRGYREGTLDAFNGRDAPWGHGPTNTSKWTRLSRPVLYRVQYEPKYEPFIVLSRHQAPWFDERFVGYGGNKIAYMNQLSGLGFGFHVHPYGFAIHVPHARTKAADHFVAEKQRGESEMEELRRRVESKVEKGTYVPVIRHCERLEAANAAVQSRLEEADAEE